MTTEQTTLPGVQPPALIELHYVGEQDEGAVLAWGRIDKRRFLEQFIREGVIFDSVDGIADALNVPHRNREHRIDTIAAECVKWCYGSYTGDTANDSQGRYFWKDEPEDGLRPVTVLEFD